MLSITDADLGRMRRDLLFDGPERGRKLSRFWTLLILASLIATAGVLSDSTATVIGAMIVAPLMTPILGTVLSVVTRDGPNLARSLLPVAAGSAAVVGIGWLFGHLAPLPVVAATNSQVAGRVHPHLVDLVAALATGAVGAFALVRDDVSDTLPGVAIAISLVPPLVVVGLTLESGAGDQARGAMLLFLTNVGAILFSGLIVMALYRVGRIAGAPHGLSARQQRTAAVLVVAFVIVIALPLGASTKQSISDSLRRSDVTTVAEAWAKPGNWEIVNVDTAETGIVVRAIGPLPAPDPRALRSALDAKGLKGVDVRLELLPLDRVDLPGS
ncbi:MAG: DUF389 domain-containing protein [Gaiellaceae bacterium]